jgi:hypothetical protein
MTFRTRVTVTALFALVACGEGPDVPSGPTQADDGTLDRAEGELESRTSVSVFPSNVDRATVFARLEALSDSDTMLSSSSQTPLRADDLVDFVGINTHLNYADTAYARNWSDADRADLPADQDVRRLLVELGVRHVRDRVAIPSFQRAIEYANPRFAALHLQRGIDVLTGLGVIAGGRLTSDRLDEIVAFHRDGAVQVPRAGALPVAVPVRDFVTALQGPNEYDNAKVRSADANWIATFRAFATTAATKVRTAAPLSRTKVLLGPLVQTQKCREIGDLSDSFDAASLHPYPNYPYWRAPESSIGWHLAEVARCGAGKPVYVSETGYENGLIDESSIAKYLPRLVAAYFKRPQIARSYLYELVDSGGQRYGLVSSTKSGAGRPKLAKRAAYDALRSLLSLLSEARWDSTARVWVRTKYTPKPVPVRFVVPSKDRRGADVGKSFESLILQKADGRSYLLLWRNLEVFRPDATPANFGAPTFDLSVVFDGTPPREVVEHRYDGSFRNLVPRILARSAGKITVEVRNALSVIELRP